MTERLPHLGGLSPPSLLMVRSFVFLKQFPGRLLGTGCPAALLDLAGGGQPFRRRRARGARVSQMHRGCSAGPGREAAGVLSGWGAFGSPAAVFDPGRGALVRCEQMQRQRWSPQTLSGTRVLGDEGQRQCEGGGDQLRRGRLARARAGLMGGSVYHTRPSAAWGVR